jgi:hypothetical protein
MVSDLNLIVVKLVPSETFVDLLLSYHVMADVALYIQKFANVK